MGVDKEAADIWMFGRPRPDLTLQQTFEAREAGRDPITADEEQRRNEMIAKHIDRRTNDMAAGVMIGLRAAKARKTRPA